MADVSARRLEALDKAVRVSLAAGGKESSEDTVARAEAFLSGDEDA